MASNEPPTNVPALAKTLRELSHADSRELALLLLDGRAEEMVLSEDWQIVVTLLRMAKRRDLAMALAARWAYFGGRARAALAILAECAHDIPQDRIKAAIAEVGEPLSDPQLLALDEEINREYRR